MDLNDIVKIVMFAIVTLIVTSTILVPIVSSATADSDTFTNDGYYTMDVVTDNYSMEWSASDKTHLIVNDTSYDLGNIVAGKELTIVATQDMILRLLHTTANDTYRFTSYGGETGYWGINSTDPVNEFSLNVADGTISVEYTTSGGTNTKTYPVAPEIYALNPTDSGDYTMKSSTSSAYVLESSSIIILAGNTIVGADDVSLLAKGNVNNLEFVVINGNNVNPTFTNIVATYSESDNHVDLIELEKINFTISTDIVEALNAEYSYFLVPTEVTADRTSSLSNVMATILNVIPLIVGISIIIGVVAYIRYGRT